MPRRYRIVQTITAYRGADTTTPASTMRVGAIVTVSANRQGDALVVRATIDSGGAFVGGTTTVQWSGGTDTVSALRSRPPVPPACGADSAALGIARFFALLPEVLAPGFSARDTLRARTCSSSIPVTVDGWTRVVADDSTWPAVRIERSYTLTGAGVSGQHNVRLSGHGESTTRIELDPGAGAIARAQETARVVMDVTASGRTMPVWQRTETDLELIR